jgi:hypothetical protein
MKFTVDEIVQGMKLTHLLEQAQMLVAERERVLHEYISMLARARGLSGEITLNDWVKGFEVQNDELHHQ